MNFFSNVSKLVKLRLNVFGPNKIIKSLDGGYLLYLQTEARCLLLKWTFYRGQGGDGRPQCCLLLCPAHTRHSEAVKNFTIISNRAQLNLFIAFTKVILSLSECWNGQSPKFLWKVWQEFGLKGFVNIRNVNIHIFISDKDNQNWE